MTPSQGCYTWPPLLPSCTSIIFFRRATTSPKMVFFNPIPILGLKKHHFGAPVGTRKKFIEVHDKKRAKKGVPPFEVILGHFGHSGGLVLASQGIQASRENGTPPMGGHLRGPPEGQFCTPCMSRAKSTLGSTSEMTPDGWCTVFSAGLDSWEG